MIVELRTKCQFSHFAIMIASLGNLGFPKFFLAVLANLSNLSGEYINPCA